VKTVLFVPGFKEGLDSRHYAKTLKAIEDKGYKVEFVPIHWLRTTITDWVTELNRVYSQHDPKETILAGFSYGSMTAFVAASQRLPGELWLFSLSPYFSEDIPLLKLAWLRTIGKQRTERFWRVSFNELAPKVTCKTLLFAGGREIKKYVIMGKRATEAERLLAHAKLFIIPGVGHDVADSKYIEAIKEHI